MRVRCVGGDLDGKWHPLDCNERTFVYRQPMLLDVNPAEAIIGPALGPGTPVAYRVRNTTYCLHQIRNGTRTFVYAAPEGMSDQEALRQLFGESVW